MTGTDVHAHARLWLRRMLQVRRFEEQLILLYDAGEVAGHYHVCIGQEGTAVGVLAHAGPDDVVYTTHRNHGHLLLRGADPERLFAEILGRATGYSRGRSGTLHLSAPELGVPWSSALVGGNVPQAIGAAYALARLRPGSIVVCFFGDGTFEEGAVFEALNTAAVLALPILFVCENNGLSEDHGAAGAFPTSSTAAERLSDLPGAFQIPSLGIDGIDAHVVSDTVARLAHEVRSGGGPRFVETASVRWPGSRALWPTLPGGSFQVDWLTGAADPPAEIAAWTRNGDPLRPLYERLLAAGETGPEDLQAIDAEVRAEIERAAGRAVAAPLPAAEAAFDMQAGTA